MGVSAPPKASIDLIGSFARRRGADVEIVLAKPSEAITTADLVTLTRGKKSVRAFGQLSEGPAGSRFVIHVPRQDLGNGQWAIRVPAAEGPDTTLEARLLVQGERPLVLLWGATPTKSVVPSPAPKPLRGRRKAAHEAGKALDRVLAVLPPPQAKKVRSGIRRTARRVLR